MGLDFGTDIGDCAFDVILVPKYVKFAGVEKVENLSWVDLLLVSLCPISLALRQFY